MGEEHHGHVQDAEVHPGVHGWCFPVDLTFWVNFFETGMKTACLLVCAAAGIQLGLVCDMHILGSLRRLGLARLTNHAPGIDLAT